MSTSCLLGTVSLSNRYTNRQMASFQSSDATVRKNITYAHSFTQFLLSLIHPNCTINFFIGTLYCCNGGWILKAVGAVIKLGSLNKRAFIGQSVDFRLSAPSIARYNELNHRLTIKGYDHCCPSFFCYGPRVHMNTCIFLSKLMDIARRGVLKELEICDFYKTWSACQ